MNKLQGQIAYLAGPIEDSEDAGRGWREEITEWLSSLNCGVLDPCKKPNGVPSETKEDRDRWGKYKREGDFDSLVQEGRWVRRVDLKMVDHCDFLIVYLDLNSKTCGTWEEIFSANYKKRPILIVCPQGKKSIPIWLFWTMKEDHKMFFSSFDELKDFLTRIDNGSEKASDRWIFWVEQTQQKEK